MKKYLMTLAAVLCCAMSSMMFTACGDDNQPPVDENAIVSQVWDIKITQDISDPEVKNYLPVKVCFYDANGVMQVESMPGETYNKTVTYEKGSGKFGFAAVRMIENFDKLEEGTLSFNVGLDITGTVTVTHKNGKVKVIKIEEFVGGFPSWTLSYAQIEKMHNKKRNYTFYSGLFYVNNDEIWSWKSGLNQDVRDKLGLNDSVSDEE